MKTVIAAILITCLFSSCTSFSHSSASTESTAPDLKIIAGTWRFSHFGPASIVNSKVPNAAEEIKKHLTGTTIAIEESGKMSMIAPGHAASGEVVVVESTRLYLKIGVKNQPKRNAWVYDRASRLMMMPSELIIESETGVLPTYFKKIK